MNDLEHWAEMIEVDQELIGVLAAKRLTVPPDIVAMITEQIERSEANIAYYQELIDRSL